MLLRVLKLSVCVLSAASLSVSVRLSVPSRWYGTINLYAVSTGRFELGLGGLENARVSLLPMSVTNPELGLCYRIYAISQDLAMSHRQEPAGTSHHTSQPRAHRAHVRLRALASRMPRLPVPPHTFLPATQRPRALSCAATP